MPIIAVPAHDPFTEAAVMLLSVFIAVVWTRQWPQLARVGAILWLMGTGAFASSGILTRFDLKPPPMMIMIAASVVCAIAIGALRPGRDAAARWSLAALIGLQAFRLPLELVMHRAAGLGIVPAEMTWTGYNFDVITGISALAIGLLMAAGVVIPRGVIWTWSVYGFCCLAAILAIAVAGSPMVHAFGTDPRHVNSWVLFTPYVWVPTVCVVVAISGQIVIVRKLFSTT